MAGEFLGLNASDWVAAGSAVATGVMAVVTARMAHFTRKAAEAASREAEAVAAESELLVQQAEATTRQAELSQQTLRASIQPWLRETERCWIKTVGPVVQGSFMVENVGPGIALLHDQRSHVYGWDQGHRFRPFAQVFTETPVLPSATKALLTFHMDTARWPPLDPETFLGGDSVVPTLAIEVCSSDTAGDQVRWNRFYLIEEQPAHEHRMSSGSAKWGVYRIEYRDDPEGEPVVAVNRQSVGTERVAT